MFFIIPIGVEATIKKLPKITIALIILNIIFYFLTTSAIKKQEERLIALTVEKQQVEVDIIAIENEHRAASFNLDVAADIAEQLSHDKRKRFTGGELSAKLKEDIIKNRERFKNGEIVSKSDPLYQQWLELYQKLNSLEKEAIKTKEDAILNKYGFVPAKFSLIGLLTSLFLHGGIFHLLGNMLFLWLVGCAIEDRWGAAVFLSAYLISGIAASFMHMAMFPKSLIPCIGASGAIAGIMGAFMIRHYKVKIEFFYVVWLFRLLYGRFTMFAWVALPLWFAQQLFEGMMSTKQTSGVAFWAHIGGFLFGTGIGSLLKFAKIEDKYIKPKIEQQEKELLGHPKLIEARELATRGKLAEAVPLLQEVIKEESNYVDAYKELLKIYQHKRFGKPPEDVIYVYNRIIEIHFKKHQKVEALVSYSDLIEIFPQAVLEPRNLYSVAKCLRENGDYERAFKLWQEFITRYPDNNLIWRVFLDCGDVCSEKLQQPEQAREYFQQALAKNPSFEWIDIIKEKIRKLG